MKTFSYILLFIATVLLTGCDPGHNLVFVNKTKSDAFVKIKMHSDSMDIYDRRLKAPSKELDSVIVIKPESSYEIPFGIGTWHYEEIENFSRFVKEIKIDSENKTVIYNSGVQIEKLLKNNRKSSIGNVKINIEIN